jgi:ABC-type uncharacterized transport system substrate-binding protein
MRRREFIGGMSSAAVAWPAAVRAQQPTPVIGFLSGATFDTMREYLEAFHPGLADAGFAQGLNVAIEYRWAEGNNDRLPSLAADLVRREVSIIVAAASTPAALAAKAATITIPIVFFVGTDPVEVGLVASLSRPGGNATGMTVLNVELLSKNVELMRRLLPSETEIAVLVNPANPVQTSTEVGMMQDAARILGARVTVLNATNAREIETAFATLINSRIGALVVSGENFFLTERALLVELAARHAVPTVYPFREFVLAGGLMSYGAHVTSAFRQIGVYTGRILKGEKAADLPVQQLTRVELAINLKTAKALGIDIPTALLGRADVVIE